MTTTLEQILPQIANVAKLFANGDQHTADDIASEAIAYICERGFQNETPAFILQQVKWQALAHVDRATAYTKYVGSIETATATSDDEEELDWTEYVCDLSESPEDIVADREQSSQLEQAVARLDAKAQVIIALLRNGHSFAEIANKLGVSRSAVSQKMNTIQNTLSAVLG
jgi:RNA polymerase sigma factor (sigma-70 family)